MEGRDDLDALAADLIADERVERCLVVDEVCRWMFGRPIAARLRELTGCGTGR